MISEIVRIANPEDYYSLIPDDCYFAEPARLIIDQCIPFWLESSSRHGRKAYKSLHGEELDNTQGHVLPILRTYLEDCHNGLTGFNVNKALSLSMHDDIEDFDDFADIEAMEAGLAPNSGRLIEMRNAGVNNFVLGVILTCTKDRERKDETDEFRRDKNLLSSLSQDTVHTPDGKMHHALKLAERLYEYGYILADEIETWQQTFLEQNYDEMLSTAREVKMRDRCQSISQDLELMQEAVIQGKFEISGLNYVEKTRILLAKMYGEEKPHDPDELLLYGRLQSKMNESIKYEMENIFKKVFLELEGNQFSIARYNRSTNLMKAHVFQNEELTTFLDLTLVMKDYILERMKGLVTLEQGKLSVNPLVSFIEILKHDRPDIFTKDRIQTNHFAYALSVLLSHYSFDLQAEENIERAQDDIDIQRNREIITLIDPGIYDGLYEDLLTDSVDTDQQNLGTESEYFKQVAFPILSELRLVHIPKVRTDLLYQHLKNQNLEGAFSAAIDCYLNVLDGHGGGDNITKLYNSLLKLYSYYMPIMEICGFKHITDRFENLIKPFMKGPGFAHFDNSMEDHYKFCDEHDALVEFNINMNGQIENREQQIQLEPLQKGRKKISFGERDRRLKVMKRLRGVLSHSDEKSAYIVDDNWHRDLLNSLGINTRGLYKDKLYSTNN